MKTPSWNGGACVLGLLAAAACSDGRPHDATPSPAGGGAPGGATAGGSGAASGGSSPPSSLEDGGAPRASGGDDASAPSAPVDAGGEDANDATAKPPPVGGYLLSADGVTDTYTLLGEALGGTPIDGPDCSHTAFGHHIGQSLDADLGTNVFDFFIHATPDNDRCSAFDRQRNEIKVYDSSAANLKAASGDTVAYQWKFKLDAGFQPSPDFCHIHQIKGGDGAGAGGAPVFTITPRHGSPDVLQVIYSSPAQAETFLTSTPLAPFLGTWVEANEVITYNASGNGSYALTLSRLKDGQTLLTYSSTSLQTWAVSTTASPTTYCRPKWGIYRSLNSPTYLRDEDVKFNDFCVAKGGSCPKDLP
ncbi:MAG TPA: hypothetical protein VGI39_41635 [Polyangiaceae bacterium]|jgi:hypothetical protein